MIRLRELLERWLRHPAVGPILILLLAVALAFLVLHEVGEGSLESFAAACATLAALGALGLLLLRARPAAPALRGSTLRLRPREPGLRAREPAARRYALRL
ncbi:MAG: hypothetical protein ACYC1P_08460 [Gaiellaceae bacterium]